MPLAGFEPAIPESEQPQTNALDRAATGIAWLLGYDVQILYKAYFIFYMHFNLSGCGFV